MFDKSLFVNHFNTGDKSTPLQYTSICTDPRGVRWGYIAQENVYEEINTGRRLSPLMLENFILEQTDTAMGNEGDYGTEAGHGSSKLTKDMLTPKTIKTYGTKPKRGRFGVFQTSSTSVYKQRNSTNGGAAESAQALISGAEFINTVNIPTIGYFSIRDSSQGAPGFYMHSSVDSAEGVTMAAVTGLADDLEEYFEEGATWSSLNRGGTHCVLTIVVDGGDAGTSADARFSDGDVIDYVWNGNEGRGVASGRQLKFDPDTIPTDVNAIRLNGLGVNHAGTTGATWPMGNASAGGTAYWGYNPHIEVGVGTLDTDLKLAVTSQIVVDDTGDVIEDISQT